MTSKSVDRPILTMGYVVYNCIRKHDLINIKVNEQAIFITRIFIQPAQGVHKYEVIGTQYRADNKVLRK